MKKILAFGEIIWDVYPDASAIGGAALNFAAHVTASGGAAYLFSAVGEDSLGDKAIDEISGFGINTSFIKRSDRQTGRCDVSLDKNGVPSFKVIEDTAYDNIRITERDIAEIRAISPDVLYFGTLIQRGEVSRASLARLISECSFGEIVCDINLRKNCYDRDSAQLCLKKATILKLSDEEEPLLRELGLYRVEGDSHAAIARAICESYKNVRTVLLTLGGNGSFIYESETGEHFYVAAKPARVASTVGAGDSYVAAFLVSYLSGAGLKRSAELASTVSGYVVAHTEAVPSYTLRGGEIVNNE